jgi:hypothetical protein
MVTQCIMRLDNKIFANVSGPLTGIFECSPALEIAVQGVGNLTLALACPVR